MYNGKVHELDIIGLLLAAFFAACMTGLISVHSAKIEKKSLCDEISRLENEIDYLKSSEGRRDQTFEEFENWCDWELTKSRFAALYDTYRSPIKGIARWQSRYQREEIRWMVNYYDHHPVILTSLALPEFNFQIEVNDPKYPSKWQCYNEVVPTGKYSIIYCKPTKDMADRIITSITYTQMLQALREQGVFNEILSPTSPDFNYWQVNGLKNPEGDQK